MCAVDLKRPSWCIYWVKCHTLSCWDVRCRWFWTSRSMHSLLLKMHRYFCERMLKRHRVKIFHWGSLWYLKMLWRCSWAVHAQRFRAFRGYFFRSARHFFRSYTLAAVQRLGAKVFVFLWSCRFFLQCCSLAIGIVWNCHELSIVIRVNVWACSTCSCVCVWFLLPLPRSCQWIISFAPRIRILTGRQHQIRSHFAHVGHPTIHVTWRICSVSQWFLMFHHPETA